MSSRKQGSQTRDNNLLKNTTLENQLEATCSKMRGASSGKKTAVHSQRILSQLSREVGGGCSAENPASGSMRKTRKNKQKTPGNGDGGSTSKAPQPPRKKRSRTDSTVESEEPFKNRMEIKVRIPEELKPWLVEDWDLVTRQKQLFQLPAKKNVDAILEEYANCKKSQGNVDNRNMWLMKCGRNKRHSAALQI